MKQEDKELLLKDLSARLPYGVICHIECEITLDSKINAISVPPFNYPYKADVHTGTCGLSWEHIQLAKPYLRSMSSMTEEEQYICRIKRGEDLAGGVGNESDYLNSIHVDYRGLIEKGLAIEVTEENNPYK